MTAVTLAPDTPCGPGPGRRALTFGGEVGVVLEGVAADEADVVEEVLHRVVLEEVDLRHHRRQVHRLLDHLVVVGHLAQRSAPTGFSALTQTL